MTVLIHVVRLQYIADDTELERQAIQVSSLDLEGTRLLCAVPHQQRLDEPAARRALVREILGHLGCFGAGEVPILSGPLIEAERDDISVQNRVQFILFDYKVVIHLRDISGLNHVLIGVNGPVRRLLRNAVIVDVKADTVSEDHVEHVDVAIDRSLQRFEDAAIGVRLDIDLTRVAAGRNQDAPHSSTSILRPFPARIRSC